MAVIPLTLHQTKFKLYCWLQAAFAVTMESALLELNHHKQMYADDLVMKAAWRHYKTPSSARCFFLSVSILFRLQSSSVAPLFKKCVRSRIIEVVCERNIQH